MQRALAEVELEHLGDVLLHLSLEDDVLTGDAEVDVTLSNKGGDIRRRKENSSKRQREKKEASCK